MLNEPGTLGVGAVEIALGKIVADPVGSRDDHAYGREERSDQQSRCDCPTARLAGRARHRTVRRQQRRGLRARGWSSSRAGFGHGGGGRRTECCAHRGESLADRTPRRGMRVNPAMLPVMKAPGERPGLCLHCVHAQRVASRTSLYWRCVLAESDARFERYPRLPVLHCDGFVPAHGALGDPAKGPGGDPPGP